METTCYHCSPKKDLHEVDYTQLYDFLKYNQAEYARQNVGNQNGYNAVHNVRNQNVNQNRNGNVVAARAEGNGNGNANNGIQLQAEEFNFMAAVGYLEEIEEVNSNCILMANLQQAATSEEQYIELLKPISEPHQVQQNDINVISTVSSVEQSGGTVEQNPATIEETRAYFESLYNNLAIEVEKVNKAKSHEESYFSNTSKMASVSKSISIPNAEFSDDTYPSVAQKFLNENFEIQFLKEAAKFVRDFKSLAKEADESLARHKDLEYEIKRLLKAVISQDIMPIVQSNFVVDTLNHQTELDRTKEKLENCIIEKEKEYVVLWNNWYKNVRNANMIRILMIKLIMT
ncbi:hypothetical protein Tco_0923901 [Tanacetum coccineum]|uniref:Uncharacterized protein n=1 Tax=Tanacetum coccineum TaxID=301880 RepID=A0ABQ5D523_9ASTR